MMSAVGSDKTVLREEGGRAVNTEGGRVRGGEGVEDEDGSGEAAWEAGLGRERDGGGDEGATTDIMDGRGVAGVGLLREIREVDWRA